MLAGRFAMNLHEIAEERSLVLHEEIARRLVDDPSALTRARARVEEWIRRGSVHPDYAMAWREVLARPLPEIVAFLSDRGEAARSLRQVSPFAGLVPPRTRWRIWREVRERLTGSG